MSLEGSVNSPQGEIPGPTPTYDLVRRTDTGYAALGHPLENLALPILFPGINLDSPDAQKYRKQFEERFNAFDYVVIAKEGDEIIGFTALIMLHANDKKILYVDGAVVRPEHQKSQHLLQMMALGLYNLEPDYVAAISQNPAVIIAMGGRELPYPIVGDYQPTSEIYELMLGVVKDLRITDKMETIDGRITGVIKGRYDGQLGYREIDPSKVRDIARIQERMSALGVDPKNGDSLLLLVKNPIRDFYLQR